jgi:hypothetical protein
MAPAATNTAGHSRFRVRSDCLHTHKTVGGRHSEEGMGEHRKSRNFGSSRQEQPQIGGIADSTVPESSASTRVAVPDLSFL